MYDKQNIKNSEKIIRDIVHDEKSDTTDHNISNFPKVGIESYERRINTVMNEQGKVFAVTGHERDCKSKILFLSGDHTSENMLYDILYNTEGISGFPDISSKKGRTDIAWLKKEDTLWKIGHIGVSEHTSFDCKEIVNEKPVIEEKNLCMHPCISQKDGILWIVCSFWDWADQSFKIRLVKKTEKETQSVILSTPVSHCFRPCIVCSDNSIAITWDFYDTLANKYGIEIKILDDSFKEKAKGKIVKNKHDCMNPALSTDGINFYMAFIIIGDVRHKEMGIIDHEVFAGFACIKKEGNIIMWNDPSINDYTCAADLREGLLGKESYCGYYGLRRFPRPVILSTGDVWLVWEMMFEKGYENRHEISRYKLKSHAACGSLTGKKMKKSGWSEQVILHNGGLNYAVPAYVYGEEIPVVYFDQLSDKKNPKFKIEFIQPDNGLPFKLDSKYTAWWEPIDLIGGMTHVDNMQYQTKCGDNTYNLYWADTHIHSIFSPDAEGEPDEIIFYAKNKSKIHVMAMVDNDFYPFYAYTGIKWAIQCALAEIFTKKSEFMVFPGYEYTYHNKRYANGFNHRYILFLKYDEAICRRIDPGSETIEGLMVQLKNSDSLAVAHHTTWELTNSENDRNVEICSSWRVCMEESLFVKRKLDDPIHFGFIGSSDTHRACPGLGGALTGIYAEELTPQAIFDAYRNHRTFVTQGYKVIIDFKISDFFIGQECIIEKDPILMINVQSPIKLEYVEVIKDGYVLKRYEPLNECLNETYSDDNCDAGIHYYYLRVKMEGDEGFNSPDGIKDDDFKIFYNTGKYAHNFAKAQGPFAWSTPIRVKIIK